MHTQEKQISSSRKDPNGILITGLLCAFVILQFFLQSSLSVMSHEIKMDFDLDAASMSLLSSAFFYSYILLQVPVGLILDRFGMKMTCFLALLFMSLSCFAFSVASSFRTVFLLRIVMGAGASFGFIAMLRSIKLYFPAERFIFVMSLAEAVGMVGVATLNIFFSYLTDLFTWRVAIATSGGTSLLLALFWIRVNLGDEFVSDENSVEEMSSKVSMWSILSQVISNRLVWFNGLFAALLYSIMTVFVALWGIPYTEKLYDISTTEAASIVSLVYIGLGIASLFLSYVLKLFGIKLVVRVGAFLSLVFLGWYIYFPPTMKLFAYLLLFLVGAFSSVYQLSFGIVANHVPKVVQSTAGGVTNMLCMSGAPLLQPLVGVALTLSQGGILDGYESYGVDQYRSAFILLMVCIAFGFWVSWFVLPGRAQKSRE